MKILSFLNYLLLIAIVTIVIALIYATVQQSYRTGANDPQIQMAENVRNNIERGKSLENLFPADTIDIAKSLSPFVVLYNASGKPIRSSGYLDEKMPSLPAGVFDFAKKNGQHDVTWQPQPQVRMAMVLIHVNSLPAVFVAAGRSLREVEMREYNLRKMVFLGWIICVGIILLCSGIKYYIKTK